MTTHPQRLAEARGRLSPAVMIALGMTYFVWGSTYLAAQYTLASIPPFLGVGVRLLIGGGLLYAILRWRGVASPTRIEWRNSALTGVFLCVGGIGGVMYCQQWLTSGLAAISLATVPIWAVLFAGLWGQWPLRHEWIGVLVGFAGVVMLFIEGSLSAIDPLAIGGVQLAAASWALGSILSRHLKLPNGTMFLAAQNITGGAIVSVFGLLQGERWPAQIAPLAFGSWLYLLVFASLVTYAAYLYLLREVSPALATSYAYVNPLVAVILGVLLAGERFTAAGIAGMLIIFASVGLLAISHRRQHAEVS
jgi:drug/metabolite transporter (DMT)-like permease